ncbi:MAG: 2-oxoglutarate oxidoreductase [Muribaculaceae bacterium]|nr:2-oxoglutarate oxidoreductase [Bacteroides sp.]MDE6679803.1 2-oxoglutarate oxidoreductase [Muribaculaceae bacterium]MDE6803019.1 2-oxoglutarate oxidoreductase [Muribaculaceae bacterium]MDE6843018.1 2-oxoglutarate oxidoreductase [Muribaculaceae bacterium]MDE7190051.1 2-oxoglutarate oxidoreductase [Muribaculaceae bacterium]
MEIQDIIRPENKVYSKPELLDEVHMHYCPGCSHGVIHKLLAEVIAEMGITDRTVGVSPVGCAVFAYNYIDVDWVEAAHGRAPAVATAISRLWPQDVVFTYQGDGDMSAIGTAESIHAANRGENIVMVFVNNAIYGMTGGQMAPTTLVGQKTATTPYGRRVDLNGHPLEITNLMAILDGTCYVTRQSVHTAANVRKAKAALKKAFENAIAKRGTSVVEIVSTCNSGWKLSPEKSNEWMVANMFEKYPLGDLKNN